MKDVSLLWVIVVIELYLFEAASQTNNNDHHNDLRSKWMMTGHRDHDPVPSSHKSLSRSNSNSNPFDKNSKDLCGEIYCPRYQECKIVDGFFPICACRSYCRPRNKTVCGSDGKWYANKCEMHRESCNAGYEIKIATKRECRRQVGGNEISSIPRDLSSRHGTDAADKAGDHRSSPHHKHDSDRKFDILKYEGDIVKRNSRESLPLKSDNPDLRYEDLKSILADDMEDESDYLSIDGRKRAPSLPIHDKLARSEVKFPTNFSEARKIVSTSVNQVSGDKLVNIGKLNDSRVVEMNSENKSKVPTLSSETALTQTNVDTMEGSFEAFKHELMNFFKEEYIDANDPFIHDDPYVINLMLNTFDTNGDTCITAQELQTFSQKWDFSTSTMTGRPKIFDGSSFDLVELLEKYDENEDGKLDVKEFYRSFGIKIPDVDSSTLPTEYRVVKVGTNLKLNCNAKYLSAGSVIWKRYGSPLNNRELQNIKIFSDGSLYIVGIQPYLSGNYTYQLAENNMAFQTYVVLAITEPKVRIRPKGSQLVRPTSTATIKCRASGYPIPDKLVWYKNDKIISENAFSGNGLGIQTLVSNGTTGKIDGLSAFRKNGIPISGMGGSKSLSVLDHNGIGGREENEIEGSEKSVYKYEGNGTVFTIDNVRYYDTGAYTCQFSSAGGTVRAHSNVFVVEDEKINLEFEEQRHTDKLDLYVFDESGVRVYDAISCKVRERIRSNHLIPPSNPKFDHNTEDRMSGHGNFVCGTSLRCQWGASVNVRDKFIYIIQVDTSKIMVLEIATHTFKEKIMSDMHPTSLKYIPSLDQVWVMSHPTHGNLSSTGATIQVIRDASKAAIHDIIHTEPIQGKFDKVADLFVPDAMEDVTLRPKYGYTTHYFKMYMYKLNLELLRYESLVDLAQYNCVPKDVAFYLYGGFVIVRCINMAGYDKGQLILDYILDTVIKFDSSIHGKPSVSPDQTYVASIDTITRIIKFQEFKQTGIRYLFDIVAPINPTNKLFHLSPTFGTYDLIFASDQQNGIVFFNMFNHKSFDIINDYYLEDRPYGNDSTAKMSLISSGPFGDYIALTKGKIIILFDSKHKSIHCQISDSRESNLTLQWIYT